MQKNSKNNREEWIKIKGANTHNLKNVSLKIPRNTITVFTGLSGSGKSSLAFDTIFAEGQRRYIESLSAYARQFLNQIQKPEVEEITGLSPAISIDQKSRSNNPRSIVATITEIYDYLRVLYARIGEVHCPKCGREIAKTSQDQIKKNLLKKIENEKWLSKNKKIKGVYYNDFILKIYSPVVIGRKGEYYQLLYDLLSRGFEKVKVDGSVKSLREKIVLSKHKKHTIEVLVDEIHISELLNNPKETKERLSEGIERALQESDGVLKFEYPDKTDDLISINFFCPYDGSSFPELEPRLFSFNSPYGACSACNGLGVDDPIFMDEICKVCNGTRLRKEALCVLLNGKNIIDLIGLSIESSYKFFASLKLTKNEHQIADTLLKEISSRIEFMIDVGLEYLALDRRANTLSGGEAQRIRLASQLGSGLVGALYVLDEPTIGLHQRDNARLIKTLYHLKELGNSIIVVEHDENTIFASDYIVDIGPKAGVHGGEIVVADFLDPLLTAKTNKSKSSTLSYLRGEKVIATPVKRRTNITPTLFVKGATLHNIKNMDVKFPLNRLISITGVSGSGKSTLLHDILYSNLRGRLDKKRRTIKLYHVKEIKGTENLGRVIFVDQSPIGRTPRSTPATYTGAFTHIRDLFASTERARYFGYKAGRFSFNVKGGRCENCDGNGVIAIEMHFLPTVFVVCDVCKGKRFSKDTLSIKYKDKNIYEILQMSVEVGMKFFHDIPAIYDRLKILNDVGLSYLELGQPSNTLSGGEAQRIKISSELYRPMTTKTIYLLDEPTIGLHYDDVAKLIKILNKLVDRGNTVVLIEHNMDIIKCSDYVIDIGPEGGTKGGKLVGAGTPEQIIKIQDSYTGKFLKPVLKKK